MITKNDLEFNCCESTIMRVDEGHPLPGFDLNVTRIASAFGGGLGGWGSACGAVSGVVMALGLIYGTEGNEIPDEFKERRMRLRDMAQEFMAAFEKEFRSVNCMDLLEVDRRTEEGKRRYEELKEQGVFHCGEYVEWAVERILQMLGSES